MNIPNDKQLHILIGYVACTFFPVTPAIGFVIAMSAGMLKEAWDYYSKKGTPDMWDFIATCSGGTLGSIALMMK